MPKLAKMSKNSWI